MTHALLLTDIVDSTKLSEQLGDAAIAALWAQHDRGGPTCPDCHSRRLVRIGLPSLNPALAGATLQRSRGPP